MTVYRFDNQDGSVAFYHCRYRKRDGSKGFYYAYPVAVLDSDATLTDPHTGKVVSVARGLPPLVCDLVYRLPELVTAVRTHAAEIWCPEGERDCESLRALGCVATTGWGGAGQWDKARTEAFRGFDGQVSVVVDNDAPGAAEGVLKYDSLSALGVRVQLYRPPQPHKDVSDLLAAGGDVGDLEEVDRDELAEFGAAWPAPSRRSEWLTYGLDTSFLARVLHSAQP